MTVSERDVAPAQDAASVLAEGTLADGAAAKPAVWQIAEETPVAVMLNSRSLAVMMATPADLEDFGIGFALSEGFLRSADAVRNVLVLPHDRGFAVDIAADEAAILTRAVPRRAMEGRSGCGLCGVDEIEAVVRPLPRVETPIVLEAAAVRRAFQELPAHQPINSVNHSVHAAAWCDPSGAVRLAREDVGRHCALDKLVGAMGRQGIDPRRGFVAMSSRLSFELVQKAATVGIGAIATISAPTSLALAIAADVGVSVASAAGRKIMLFQPGE
ncbi:MAG: formate dehydrogenase accessory sulfurtransferase FdhD [Parvibaculaceae bacterium]